MTKQLNELAQMVKENRVRFVDLSPEALLSLQQHALDVKDIQFYDNIESFILLTHKVKYRLVKAI